MGIYVFIFSPYLKWISLFSYMNNNNNNEIDAKYQQK